MDAIRTLKENLQKELPGIKAQMPLSPVQVEVDKYYQTPEDARQAAVMCLIHSKADRWFVSYILRTSHQLDKHAGQISFPGGRKDVSDADLLACAIRETYEEIGIHADQIDLLGSLSPLYVYASHHYVQPFVGIIHEAPRYVLEPREVQRVIEVPLDLLTSHNVIKYTDLNIHGYQLHNVPYYDINGEILWGATAMMTSELIYLWN